MLAGRSFWRSKKDISTSIPETGIWQPWICLARSWKFLGLRFHHLSGQHLSGLTLPWECVQPKTDKPQLEIIALPLLYHLVLPGAGWLHCLISSSCWLWSDHTFASFLPHWASPDSSALFCRIICCRPWPTCSYVLLHLSRTVTKLSCA